MFPSVEIERERIESIVTLWYRIRNKRSYAVLFADLPDGFSAINTPASYDANKSSGICVTTGCDNRTTGGKVLCQECRDNANTTRKRREATRTDAGLCKCGNALEGPHKTCRDCRKKAALARRKRRAS